MKKKLLFINSFLLYFCTFLNIHGAAETSGLDLLAIACELKSAPKTTTGDSRKRKRFHADSLKSDQTSDKVMACKKNDNRNYITIKNSKINFDQITRKLNFKYEIKSKSEDNVIIQGCVIVNQQNMQYIDLTSTPLKITGVVLNALLARMSRKLKVHDFTEGEKTLFKNKLKKLYDPSYSEGPTYEKGEINNIGPKSFIYRCPFQHVNTALPSTIMFTSLAKLSYAFNSHLNTKTIHTPQLTNEEKLQALNECMNKFTLFKESSKKLNGGNKELS